jgi:hypothetical protein
LGSQVIDVVETWVWTADKQPVALLAEKWLGSASNSAASDKKEECVEEVWLPFSGTGIAYPPSSEDFKRFRRFQGSP